MFIDEVKIEVKAGRGGNGIVAYRRELKVDKGGPFGGNGGKGSDIVFVGDEGLSTLLDLRYTKIIKGQNGVNGATKGMHGKNAQTTYVRVPLGTIVYDEDKNIVIADITKHKMEVTVAKGGRGGRGNMAFASGSNKCPDFCEKGEPGETKNLKCELKVLADCGLVGFPSVGKSTLISAISKARPKIASYHFTTLVPNLGMVYVKDHKSFVMADLPGIIENASQGAGLGLRFLKHIERCRVIVHVIDMSASEGRCPYEDYLLINEELKSYKMNLINRPQIIVANKMDLESSKENLVKFKEKLPDKKIIAISAYQKNNLQELIYEISDLLDKTNEFSLFEDEEEDKLFVNYIYEEEEEMFKIVRTGPNSFDVVGDRLYKLVQMSDLTKEASLNRFLRQLRSFKIDDKLKEQGAKENDEVNIYGFIFDFIE